MKKRTAKPKFKPQVLSGWENNTPEQLSDWYLSLTMDERLDVMDSMAELMIALHGTLPEKPHVAPVPGRVEVVSLPESEIRRTRRSR